MHHKLRIITVAVLLAVILSGCDWLQFRFGPEHTGFNPVETTVDVNNVGQLVQKWTLTTGGLVQSSPVEANGVVYVISSEEPVSVLHAVDATSGFELWTATLNAPAFEGAALGNGMVYVDTYTVSTPPFSTPNVFAFDAAGNTNCSGTPKICSPVWSAGVPSLLGGSVPTVSGGTVFVTSADNIYAFDASNGALLRAYDKLSRLNAQGWGESATVADGVMYGGSSDNDLYAFDAAGGTNCCFQMWTGATGHNDLPSGAHISAAPAVANGVVYVASQDDTLYAFDAAGNTNCSGTGTQKTCTPLWTATAGGPLYSSPAVANGVVYVGSLDHNLYAFDAKGNVNCSGTPKACSPLWTAPTAGGVESSPGIANGVVYVGSDDHNLYAFDAAGNLNCSGSPKACTPLWTATTGALVNSSPAIAHGMLYVGSYDDKVYAYGLP